MRITTNDCKVLKRFFADAHQPISIDTPEDCLLQNDLIDYIDSSDYENKEPALLVTFKTKEISNAYETIIKFGPPLERISSSYVKETFVYLKNTDGSIRWFFPKKGKANTEFIHLYNANTSVQKLKSNLAKWGCSILGPGVIADGEFHVYTQTGSLSIYKKYEDVPYCVFTGTRGVDQNLVISKLIERQRFFDKIPVGKNSFEGIKNEEDALSIWGKLQLQSLCTPSVKFQDNVLRVESVKPSKMLRQDKLEAEHLTAIVDVTKSTFYHQKLKESKYFIEIASKINSLAQKEDVSKIYKTLINKLDLLFKSIDSTTDFVSSLSHGDFTPWNMYRSEGKLHLYDLEASSFAPALVDLFHFIVQSEVLLKGNSFKKIQNQIQNLHDEPKLAALIQDYKIDTQLHLQLYLLHSVSTQVLKYIEQDEELHVQSHWLIESWSVLLDYVIVDGKKQSMREQFLESFAEEMSTVKYVWLKSFEKKIVSLAEESDIDLLIDKNDLNSVIKQLRKLPYVAKVDLFNYKHMKTVRLFFKDATSISLDYIFSFERKARKLMSIKNILSDRVLTEEGIFVPQIKYDLEFTILFYLSNEANVPKKHTDYFLSLNGDQKKSLIRYMNDKYRLNFSDLNSFLIYSQDYKKHLDKEIDKKKQNKIWLKSLRWFGYTFFVFKNLFHRKGIVVSISGVDGAGKSTLINALKHQLQKRLRQEVVVLRHRPCVLPILSSFKHGKKKAEKLASITMPRQGRNNSNLSSWLRFAYYYIDYLFGQIYVYLRYTLLGKVVIYDRYYFDFINDPERSNIRLKGNIVKKLYAFIRKPEINILLYASPEVILQRKQELSKEDIEILTDKYITCFQDLANGAKDTGYHPVRNDVFEDTLERTVGLCLATI